jgi:transcriptional regulator with XRE-family HTH domain
LLILQYNAVMSRLLVSQLKLGRERAGMTQLQAAVRLGLSQPYLSQLERGRRPVTPKVARAAARLFQLPATVLPLPAEPPAKSLETDELAQQLGGLGYPGYSYLRPTSRVNPAVVMFEALSKDDLDARVTGALPWVLLRYPDLDWDWLVSHAKLRNLQNRLGFLVAVAREFAETHLAWSASVARLRQVEQGLERARLAAETTLGREAMPQAEREWLVHNRPPLAERWNVLTTLSSQQLTYAA